MFLCSTRDLVEHGGLFSTRSLVEKREPSKLPDSFKIHLLKTVVKLQRLMAGSCDNVILLFLGQADELNSVTRYTDGEVSVLRLLRMSLCV